VADWEPFAGLISAVIALTTWAPWYADIFRVNKLAAQRSYRLVLALIPVACLSLLLLCIERAAVEAVRESSFYILIYFALGAASLGISSHFYSFLGLSTRDDVLERRGGAGLVAIVGALLGTTLCLIGGNIGEGPGVTVVIVSAGVALCIWFVLWYFADVLTGHLISERITVERDFGSGLRLAGLLVGNGMILGAAATGKWMPDSYSDNLEISAWPALVITVAAIFVERLLQSRPSVTRSVLIASAYLFAAVIWLWRLGAFGL
jgi:hypothetical protein